VGAAHLGDPRNDENLIIAQLHVAFFKLHNHFIDDGRAFTEAQRLTRWHYQWVIVNDFLPRMVGQDTVKKLLDDDRGRIRYNGKLYQPRNPGRPFMPVEYSGAAYRFGHSMIRAEYEIQDGHTVPIFGQDGHQDLRGSRPIPANMWMDWNHFFDVPGMHTPDGRNMARLIDTKISLPLSTLPSTVVTPAAGAITALAERNLLRQAPWPAGRPGRRQGHGCETADQRRAGSDRPALGRQGAAVLSHLEGVRAARRPPARTGGRGHRRRGRPRAHGAGQELLLQRAHPVQAGVLAVPDG
jgi:hypothetical protein